jgi:hypothetical protein
LYIVIRGRIDAYDAHDVPLLLSLVVGLLGLNALDGLVDRKSKLSTISAEVAAAADEARATATELTALQGRVESLRLSLDALHVGATATQLLADHIDVPRESIQRARRIYWSGVTLRAKLRQCLPDLGVALSHDADVTFLMVDPAAKPLKKELTVREGIKYEYIDSVLNSTLLNLQLLAEDMPDGAMFHLGFHQVFPSYGLVIINPDDVDGVCYVELYHPNNRGEAMFVVHATADAFWFRFFVEQFGALAAKCRSYDINAPDDVERVASHVGGVP